MKGHKCDIWGVKGAILSWKKTLFIGENFVYSNLQLITHLSTHQEKKSQFVAIIVQFIAHLQKIFNAINHGILLQSRSTLLSRAIM